MTSWELSPLYRHSHTLVLAHSPNLVSLHRDRLVLRSLSTLSPIRSWTLPSLPHPLTTFAASPSNPEYILVYSAKQRTAWVVDPAKEGEVARIEVGNEGCVAMAWAQTGEGANPTVMAWAAHHLHLSLFPLPSSSSPSPALQPFRILSPKHSPSASPSSSASDGGVGYSFRPDGNFLAVLERHQARDVIGVYSTGSAGGAGEWALVKSVTLPDPLSDLADLSWSPCGRYIAAWSSITDYTVHVFTPTGTLLATYTPYSSLSPPAPSTSSSRLSARTKPAPPAPPPPPPTSCQDRHRLDRSTNPYVGLGIRSVSWGRDGEWLSIGGWDGKVRVLSRHGWGAVAEVGVPVRLTGGVNVWREPPNWVSNTRGHGILSYDPVPLPHSLTPLPLDLSRPNPRMGVERIVWSESGRWAAVLNAAFPNVIAVFDFSSLLAFFASSSSSAADEEETPTRPSLHTILLLSPSSSTTSPSAPLATNLAWQPSRAFSDGEAEVLCWVSGEKGFGMWRAPASARGKGGKGERGVAECVGIPARGDFSAHSLAFASDGEALVLSSSSSTTSSSNSSSAAEGTFCVAYPVYEGDEVHVPSAGGETADDSLGVGGRTWTEDEQEEGETYL